MSRTIALIITLLFVAGSAAAQTPLGGEFVVNTTTASWQLDPAVAVAPSGEFVVVWRSELGSSEAIFARRFDMLGTPVSAEALVDSSANGLSSPDVAHSPNGGYVIAWTQNGVPAKAMMRLYGATLTPLGLGFAVDTGGASSQFAPRLSVGAAGIAVTWWDGDIWLRLFSLAGVPLISSTIVNAYTLDTQVYPAIAMDSNQDMVIVWTSWNQDGSVTGVYKRRVAWTGAMGSEALVNAFVNSYQEYADIGMRSDNSYYVVWQSFGQDGDDYGVYGRSYSSADVAGAETRISQVTAYGQYGPRITVNPNDEYTITWTSEFQDGSSDGVYARHFPGSNEYLVNTTTAVSQASPAIASGGVQEVIVWESDLVDGASTGIAAQRFAAGSVQPELIVTSLATPAAVIDNSIPELYQVTIQNLGTAIMSPAFRIGLYLSKDSIVTASDTLLTSFPVPSLLELQTSVHSITTTLPASAPRGSVYLGAIVDDLDDIAESDENNNTAVNSLSYQVPLIYSAKDVEGDQGGMIFLKWYSSPLDALGQIDLYTVWRTIDIYSVAALLQSGKAKLATPQDLMGEYDTRTLREQMTASGPLFWELVSSNTAYGRAGYAAAVPTLFDSTSVNSDYHYFQVLAHPTVPPPAFHASSIDSAYSVDDLAPGVPTAITAAYQENSVTLDWDDAPETDFHFYRVYRDVDPDFTPSPANLVQEVVASYWTDPRPDPWNYNYKISAVDFAGNEGEAGSVAVATDVFKPGVALTFALHDAVPNPFNPSTAISYSILATGKVHLVIYNVAGREVLTLIDEVQNAGTHTVQWNGMDRAGNKAASGVYLYQLRAGSLVERKRMVLLK